jgi:hypothetical protein
MRMSCNGCRVLRKGCSDACTIRPCLQWIKSPEAQANATVFLAKFYGRAGLLNLLAAPSGPGADALRPAVFRSLLYEACGRIVNPVYGSVGLLWSGQWQACQDAVEAVLKGVPIVRVSSADQPEAAASPPTIGTTATSDIRHVSKDRDAAAALLRVSRAGRTKFKRASSSSTKAADKSPRPSTPSQEQEPGVVDHDAPALSSHHDEESAGSHQHPNDCDIMAAAAQEGSSEAGSHVSQAEEHHSHVNKEDEDEVGLELTLGLEPVVVRQSRSPSCNLTRLSAVSSLMGHRLELLT